MNAISMIIRCALGQQGDGLYVFTDGLGARGFEVPDTPVVAAPTDVGVQGHGQFAMPDVAMADM